MTRLTRWLGDKRMKLRLLMLEWGTKRELGKDSKLCGELLEVGQEMRRCLAASTREERLEILDKSLARIDEMERALECEVMDGGEVMEPDG